MFVCLRMPDEDRREIDKFRSVFLPGISHRPRPYITFSREERICFKDIVIGTGGLSGQFAGEVGYACICSAHGCPVGCRGVLLCR